MFEIKFAKGNLFYAFTRVLNAAYRKVNVHQSLDWEDWVNIGPKPGRSWFMFMFPGFMFMFPGFMFMFPGFMFMFPGFIMFPGFMFICPGFMFPGILPWFMFIFPGFILPGIMFMFIFPGLKFIFPGFIAENPGLPKIPFPVIFWAWLPPPWNGCSSNLDFLWPANWSWLKPGLVSNGLIRLGNPCCWSDLDLSLLRRFPSRRAPPSPSRRFPTSFRLFLAFHFSMALPGSSFHFSPASGSILLIFSDTIWIA